MQQRIRLVRAGSLARELGSREAVAAAVRGGAWQRPVRGAYVDVPVHGDLPLLARVAAVLHVLPAGAAAADRTALALHGLDLRLDGAVEVVVPRHATLPRRTGVRARQTQVGAGDLSRTVDVPCLTPERAVADLARALSVVEAVVLLDAVLHEGLTTTGAIARELHDAAGGRGVARARVALALSDRRAESPMESRLRVPLVQAGLPVVAQHEVRDARGALLARVDLALVEARIALEYDGRAAHVAERDLVRDRQRQNALAAAGWMVLRFTAADLAVPARLVLQVRRVLASR